jgi:hypothetical protein
MSALLVVFAIYLLVSLVLMAIVWSLAIRKGFLRAPGFFFWMPNPRPRWNPVEAPTVPRFVGRHMAADSATCYEVSPAVALESLRKINGRASMGLAPPNVFAESKALVAQRPNHTRIGTVETDEPNANQLTTAAVLTSN